jgi:hypothetical protein
MIKYVTIEELNQKRAEFIQQTAHMNAATKTRVAAYNAMLAADAAFKLANSEEDVYRNKYSRLEREVKDLAYRYMAEQRPEESIQMTMPVVNVSDDDMPF